MQIFCFYLDYLMLIFFYLPLILHFLITCDMYLISMYFNAYKHVLSQIYMT